MDKIKKWSLYLKKTVFLRRDIYCCHLKIARHNKFSALTVTYVQVCTQQQKFRFFVCCEKSQVWLFFALVAIFRGSLSCYQSLKFRASCRFNKICENCEKLHAAAKIPIFRVLRKIASLTIFCVTCDFSQFFVMLIIT